MLVPIMNIDAASNALVQIGVCVSDINETENLNSAKNNELEDNAISLLDTVIATTEEYNSTYLLSDDPATVKTLTEAGKGDLLEKEKKSVEFLTNCLPQFEADLNNFLATGDITAWHQSGKPMLTELERNLQQLVAINKETAEIVHQNSQNIYQNTRNMLIFTAIIALLLAFAIAFFTTKSITVPLQKIASVASTAAEGNLTETAEIHQEDEIGNLAKAFNEMIANLSNLIKQVDSTSSEVASSAEELNASIEENTTATEQVASSTQQLSSGALSTAEQIDNVSATIEQFNTGIQSTSQNVQNVNKIALDTSSAAKKGAEFMQNASRQMGEIKIQSDQAGNAIESLGAKSQEIAKIVDIITNIADQTNLLSLNAAIEAARAGEHGRGFAVVSDEVRKLAEESANAAKEIASLIQEIEKESHNAVQAIHANTTAVNKGMETMKQVTSAFSRIVEDIENVTAMIEDISATSEQITAGSQQIGASVEQMKEIAEESAANSQEVAALTEEQNASMEEIASAAEKLSQLAENLHEEVCKFRV